MVSLATKASVGADKIRIGQGLDMFEAINIYDTCERLGVDVRFVDLNMEGMYISSNTSANPNILISNKRPFVRQFFTCAHELGHHYFNHGSQIDSLQESNSYNDNQKEEELLVNTFAGYLLMPIAGIHAQFALRNWNPYKATPIQYYLISSYFGVGYHTLIYHCRANKIINFSKAQELLKYSPSKIFSQYFPAIIENSHYKIFDKYLKSCIIELETSNYLVIPKSYSIEDEQLELVTTTHLSNVFKAIRTGITKAGSNINNEVIEIRIKRAEYIGLSENRYLANI